MNTFKNWILSIISTSPKLSGWFVFLVSLSLTLFLSFVEYQLKLSNERERVNTKLFEVENQIVNILNNSVSAAKTLAYLSKNLNVVPEFETIGREILESNPSVDAIQLLDSGKIVAIYPLGRHQKAMGYDILKDTTLLREASESIRRREIYFAGPYTIMQGGQAIVGRLPIFNGDQFRGFAVVIVFMETLIKTAHMENSPDSPLYIQFSKTNPNSGQIEHFLPEIENPAEFSGYRSSRKIELGNWDLSVQLKNSTALSSSAWSILLRISVSVLFGFLAWYFARQPSILRKKVQEQSEEILLANERFELATKATADVIWDWNLLTNEVYRSEQFIQMLGYPSEESNGNNNFWTKIIHPEDLERVKSNIKEALDGDNQYWEQEFRVRKADSSYAYIIDKGYIVRDPQGKPIRMIGATQDISKRKYAELKLLEANQSLSNANEELKVFASLASHDMKEPLRMISSFMSLLQKKYGSTLDEKANQYISFAVEGSKRLTNLINDLLDYSKVGFDLKLIEPLNINEIIEEVIKLKSDLIRESKATILVDPLPVIKGLKTPMQILFQNLIGNALKYRKSDTAPIITITGKELKDSWEFSVEDNGIGIDPDYLEHIFGILKRLHPKEKYPGTGMGLATCRKIVTQHGGKIWAESTPEKGSKFLFTIKKYE
ncbi:PAS domain S-box protein [Algoriphagus lacus]|uniref:histidine kinase n=1 Tax=Algoriphagus lacus TaxID=2056311 RepID=A0A418PQV0_9BACT|nr:ATP-binding protein [Algoriphagus lacus]RIW14980.1 PAS domain S-box protein [Algoriphagus lacus]